MNNTNKKNNPIKEYFNNRFFSTLKSYPAKSKTDLILNIDDLYVNFKKKSGIVHAIRGVSIKVKQGDIIGIVGESGSGKSVTVKSLIGFNGRSDVKANYLDFKDIDLSKIKYERNWKHIRGNKIAYIPQDPLLSLNPTKKIGEQVIETIKITRKRKCQELLIDLKYDQTKTKDEKKKIRKEIINNYKESIKKANLNSELFRVLDYIGIKNISSNINSYPHEFSGGMRQRIVIAMVIVSEPDLIIADEPTTALDVTIQAKVLDLIKKLRNELNTTIILISHNIGLVANFCNFIYVMYAGKIVEQGLVEEIFTNPRHPYTWALISSIPDINSKEKLESIPGTPPNLLIPPIGDAFALRNKYAIKIDFEKQPPFFNVGNSETHKAATWLLHDNSPMKNIPDEVIKKLTLAKKSIELKKKNITDVEVNDLFIKNSSSNDKDQSKKNKKTKLKIKKPKPSKIKINSKSKDSSNKLKENKKLQISKPTPKTKG